MNTTQPLADSPKPTQSAPYTEAQVRHWLAFLARNMQQHDQTVFLIEQLQPTWLQTRWQRWCYMLMSRTFWMVPVYELSLGLILGLVTGLIDIVRITRRQTHTQQWAARPLWTLIIDMLIYLLIYTLVDILIYRGRVLIYVLIYGLNSSWFSRMSVNDILIEVLIMLLFGAFVWNRRSTQRNLDNEIHTIETITWSWTYARRNGYRGLLVVLIGGLIYGLLNGLFLGGSGHLKGALIFGLIIGLVYGLIWGILGGVFLGLLGGLTTGIREMNTRPNQGIGLTIRHALTITGIIGLPIGLYSIVDVGLVSVVAFGLLAGLWFGGFDVLQHGLVRLLLWWRGDAPLNYARFLDYAATDLHFLQKVGGGYIFVHRYLLEHFAAMVEEGEQST